MLKLNSNGKESKKWNELEHELKREWHKSLDFKITYLESIMNQFHHHFVYRKFTFNHFDEKIKDFELASNSPVLCDFARFRK
jgi:hypothetical protein